VTGFEGRLPILSATFKRLVPHTTIHSARASSDRPSFAPFASVNFDGGKEANDSTILAQGLTWADTVDLTSTME
jgi:hypothetical protein